MKDIKVVDLYKKSSEDRIDKFVENTRSSLIVDKDLKKAVKQSDGSLRQIDFTSQEKYTINPPESGNYTYVVKAAYRNFRSNASDGKSISINVNAKSTIIPTEDDEENTDDTNTDNDTNTNTNTNTNNNSNNKPRP